MCKKLTDTSLTAMAGTITKLEIQKNNKERVNVYLDERYAFAVTLSVALGLKKGQFISEAEIAQFKQHDDRHKAYDRAIRFLGYRARSRVEVERYLRDKEYPPDVIADTVKRLVEENYLDDAGFAGMWVRNREQLKPKSRRALKYELRQKGVSEPAIKDALAEVDEADAARRALESKLNQWRHLDEETFTKKALGFLSRRGFGYEVASEAVAWGWNSLKNKDEG